MADPRFYRNTGPHALSALCAKLGLPAPANGYSAVADVAGLDAAGPSHLSFFNGTRDQKAAFSRSGAGFCLVPDRGVADPPSGMVLLPVKSVGHAWAAMASHFYPEYGLTHWPQIAVDPSSKIAPGVMLSHNVVVGGGAEIGEGTRIGPGCAIGPGVAIGCNCVIGANVTITHAYIGDGVIVMPGVCIGQPGFGYASSGTGHVALPQLGRVIVQDKVEIGANSTVDRGAIGDTVIGEGTKIDNLVQIAHNCQIGRNCVIAGQAGLAGSVVLEDGVILAGQVGLGDHTRVGAGARMGARSGTGSRIVLPGGVDYGGAPAKPVREWAREIHAVTRLAKRRTQDENDR